MKANINNREKPRIDSIVWNNLTWTDISFPSQTESDLLAQKYAFHPLALEDSLSRGQLSKVDNYVKYLLLVIHFPIMEADIVRSAWMAVIIGQGYIISFHDRFKDLTDLIESCRNNEETRNEYFSDGSGYLIYRILDKLLEPSFVILNHLFTRMDEIEDAVFDDSSDDTQAISTLRREIIVFRRIIGPSRMVIQDLKNRIVPFTEHNLDFYFDNLIDHLNRIWDNLEESKEVIEVFKDTYFVMVTNRINRIVQTLTLISSVLLPFLVVSSIYGMNINLPGGIERGSLASFGILLGIMAFLSGAMLYFFHRRHWI
ncbi:MAG: magnesium transporter CorA family protein [Dehalococcoidales bacterium]|nr:magnesium transporter CorA family protein [Dehalococcoidales bacterium]